MIQAKNSWLCVNCGHIEPITPESVPLVAKKTSAAKTISQDVSAPAPKTKSPEPKITKQTQQEGEIKTQVNPAESKVSPTQPASEPEKAIASTIPQNDEVVSKLADISTQKIEPEMIKKEVTPASAAPSSAELHPLQPVIEPSPTEPPSEKKDVVLPESATKETNKPEPVTEAPVPIVESKLDEASMAPSPAEDSSKSPTLADSKLADVLTTEPKVEATVATPPIPEKSEPAVPIQSPPTEPVMPDIVAPAPAAEPMPLPAPDAPAPVVPIAATPAPLLDSAPGPINLKTVAPETHPAPVNRGLIIWIIVASISLIALLVFGYAFYKGIDLFAGFRK